MTLLAQKSLALGLMKYYYQISLFLSVKPSFDLCEDHRLRCLEILINSEYLDPLYLSKPLLLNGESYCFNANTSKHLQNDLNSKNTFFKAFQESFYSSLQKKEKEAVIVPASTQNGNLTTSESIQNIEQQSVSGRPTDFRYI